MVHIIMKTSGDIRSSRPLRAMLAGLLLAVSATAADATPLEGPEKAPKPPAPANVTVGDTFQENCTVDVSWTQANPENIQLAGFEYRTQDISAALGSTGLGPDTNPKWSEWKQIGGGPTIRKARIVASGGNRIQLRATVSQEGAVPSDGSSLITATDLDPEHPKCK